MKQIIKKTQACGDGEKRFRQLRNKRYYIKKSRVDQAKRIHHFSKDTSGTTAGTTAFDPL